MINALFAVDESGGMGKDGDMPWPMNKEDMIWFKETTQGQVVVMGKKSWLSPDMPKPLPNRHNIVFTSNFLDREDIVQMKGDVCEGLRYIAEQFPNLEIFVIGGANLLLQAKPVLDRVLVTRIPGTYDCDTRLDMNEFLQGFKLASTINLGTCMVEAYETIQTST